MKAKQFFLIAWLAALSWGCSNVPSLQLEDTQNQQHAHFVQPQDAIRDLDLIFVIDTSLSMLDEQARLRANFPHLIRVLMDISGGLPNLHLGVITPDLGSAPYNISGCEIPGGDGGRFLKGANNACANPMNQRYIVDVEPRGCTIQKTTTAGQPTTCTAHDCTQAHCDVAAFTGLDGFATEPAGLVFAEDDGGCPRCRNYNGENLEAVFSCIAGLGTSGCGMEQPLEALKVALTGGQTENRGFLRSDAYLAVFILSDEDDCSAEDPNMFNPQGDINSSLGRLSDFRCTEFGVICDQPWRRVMPLGELTYTNCVPREAGDPKNMLFPISRYTHLLRQLKDANRILVGAITGPYEDSVTVGEDAIENPRLQPSCGALPEGAMPAVRTRAFVESMLHSEEDRSWALTPICAEDFSSALAGLGGRIRQLMEVPCLEAPVAGCPDPAFAFGAEKITALPDVLAAVCAPPCEARDISSDGDVTEIPLCAIDYLGGHPPLRDPALPVSACFHVTYNALCAIPCPEGSTLQGCDPVDNPWYGPSRGAAFFVSRRTAPTPGARLEVSCPGIPLTEKYCFNGVDDDSDGRVDADDTDCI